LTQAGTVVEPPLLLIPCPVRIPPAITEGFVVILVNNPFGPVVYKTVLAVAFALSFPVTLEDAVVQVALNWAFMLLLSKNSNAKTTKTLSALKS
jgi:hypothetical protein